MPTDIKEFPQWLDRQRTEIQRDLDDMRYKIKNYPDRYDYAGFVSEQEGALGVCLLLSAVCSKERLKADLVELHKEMEEYLEERKNRAKLDEKKFKIGWSNKISKIRQEFLGKRLKK
jgi:hypothetical protein